MDVVVTLIPRPMGLMDRKIGRDVVPVSDVGGEGPAQDQALRLREFMRHRNQVLARGSCVLPLLASFCRIPKRLSIARPVVVFFSRRYGQNDLGMFDPASARVVEGLIDALVIQLGRRTIGCSGHGALPFRALYRLRLEAKNRQRSTLSRQTS